jgi:folate-binding protein YgfZ
MTALRSASLLTLRGRDAVAFAHAQFTTDVGALAMGGWQWSAWLDAQGRVRAFFALLRPAADTLCAWLPLSGAPAMRDALAPYVFRAAVTLQADDWVLHADPAPPPPDRVEARGDDLVLCLRDGRGARFAPAAQDAFDPDALDAWERADVEARLPLLAPVLAGEFVPQALDLERLHAIRFDKGCYPGQEIAARLHFRGGNKRNLQRLRVAGAPPAPGDVLADVGGASCGRILHAARADAHASIALGVVAEGAADLRSGSGARVIVE